jgi:hypothetical protein
MDNDVYVYTGITSVSSDESNLGFILVNTRTGEFDYYPISGAEEYSAMSAAEGIVQNYGYTASFPSLILIDEEPTYVMVLKDNNGLVKKYAMVNYKNYTMATVADTLNSCVKNYNKLLNGESIDNESTSSVTEADTEVEIPDGYAQIRRIMFITQDGTTICYINTTDEKLYKSDFTEDCAKLFEGDLIKVADFEEVK